MNWLSSNFDLVLSLTVQHLRLSVVPIILGFVLSVPLGWVAYRYRVTRGVLLTVAGLLYTIPSLALFVVLPVITGLSVLSETNLILALTIYAVAIMVRSVADALDSVDPDVRRAATALGYSGWRRFWAVEFPLAGPVMLAGLRVVAVSTIALVTVGIIVGVQSLGYLFTNGFQRRIVEEVLTGVVLTMIVALVVDLLLALLGRALLPWARRGAGSRRRRPSSEGATA
ncbi:ABC transporter permease [Naasia aerilata]|uniref:Glycine/betaine ABC transporter permease n=1 Tax=Naasia aerilata TaxID=1162966 RepID=A0ABN6XSL1_9MICO|nr:ABC transporter permease [Naasia aerilata]BDZ46605.1 glycine/betaine ABC transporter permease [Naasia aerilata]